MKVLLTALSALMLVNLGACAASTWSDRHHGVSGNPKFTTGLYAPVAPEPRDSHR